MKFPSHDNPASTAGPGRRRWLVPLVQWLVVPIVFIVVGLMLSDVLHGDGWIWTDDVSPLLRALWGALLGLVGLLVCTVLTLRRQVSRMRATHELLHSYSLDNEQNHRKLREVMDSLFVFVGLVTPDGELVEANRAALEAAGLQAADVLNRHVADTYWVAYDAGVQARVREAVELGRRGMRSRFDLWIRVQGGRLILIDFMLVPMLDASGRVVALVPSGMDVTDREAARQAVRRGEEALRGIIESVPGAVYQFVSSRTEENRFTFLSPRVKDMVGIEADEILADPSRMFAMIDPQLLPDYHEAAARMRLGSSRFEFDFRFLLPGGQVRYVRAMSMAKEPAADGSRVWNGVMFDITELKNTQSALMEIQRRLELATRGSSEGVWELNFETSTRYFSESFMDMLGMSGQTMPTNTAFMEQFVHPDDHAHIYANAKAHIAGTVPHDVEYRLRTPRGYRWVRSRGLIARAQDGRPLRFAGSIVDVHDRREIEEQLRSSLAEQQRLLQREHTLLRELNHRVRNNLAGILGLVNLYQRSGRTAVDFGQAIRDKVFALRQVHDLISLTAGSSVELAKLASALADAIVPADRRVQLEFVGPPVAVSAAQSSAIAMIVQELITNSVKHGALRSTTGSTRCSWDFVAAGADGKPDAASAPAARVALQMYWHETGLTGLTPPQHRGIGLGLIEGLARSDLGGSAEFDFAPGGILCAIQLELLPCDLPDARRERLGIADGADPVRSTEPRRDTDGTFSAGPVSAEPAQQEEMQP